MNTTLKQMNRMNEYYLAKYGTEGLEEFKQFMISKGIPVNNIQFAVNWVNKRRGSLR